jgi:hypothetical protein
MFTIPSDPFAFVQDFTESLDREIHSGAEALQDFIEGQAHTVALGLLHSMLPPLVRANILAVKATASTQVTLSGMAVGAALGSADLSNTVLSGAVAKKVGEGISELLSENDYARGVNSVTW